MEYEKLKKELELIRCVVGWREDGQTFKEIGGKLGKDRSNVQKIYKENSLPVLMEQYNIKVSDLPAFPPKGLDILKIVRALGKSKVGVAKP